MTSSQVVQTSQILFLYLNITFLLEKSVQPSLRCFSSFIFIIGRIIAIIILAFSKFLIFNFDKEDKTSNPSLKEATTKFAP